jgi:hypothetical protein
MDLGDKIFIFIGGAILFTIFMATILVSQNTRLMIEKGYTQREVCTDFRVVWEKGE